LNGLCVEFVEGAVHPLAKSGAPGLAQPQQSPHWQQTVFQLVQLRVSGEWELEKRLLRIDPGSFFAEFEQPPPQFARFFAVIFDLLQESHVVDQRQPRHCFFKLVVQLVSAVLQL
jgi:hypothetical protein